MLHEVAFVVAVAIVVAKALNAKVGGGVADGAEAKAVVGAGSSAHLEVLHADGGPKENGAIVVDQALAARTNLAGLRVANARVAVVLGRAAGDAFVVKTDLVGAAFVRRDADFNAGIPLANLVGATLAVVAIAPNDASRFRSAVGSGGAAVVGRGGAFPERPSTSVE